MASITALELSVILYNLNAYMARLNYYDYNIDCAPHLDVVVTDSSWKYIPYYVELHRCQGKDLTDYPFGRICYPITKKPILYLVEERLKQNENGTLNPITLYNHTKCEYRCKRNVSSCKKNETWQEISCSCCTNIEQCEIGFEWNDSICACVTNIISVTVATLTIPIPKKDKPEGLELKYVILLVIGEFIVLVTVCSTVFVVSYYKCCNNKKDETDNAHKKENVTTKLNGEDSFAYNVDKNKKKYVVSA